MRGHVEVYLHVHSIAQENAVVAAKVDTMLWSAQRQTALGSFALCFYQSKKERCSCTQSHNGPHAQRDDVSISLCPNEQYQQELSSTSVPL